MSITRIHIKPLSVNAAYRGRRFKTPEYKAYEKSLMFILPKIILPNPPFSIYFKFGFSSSLSDFDNPVKVTIDAISKKYRFNDKLIRRGVIETEMVQPGKEFFDFEITAL